jgi:phage tail sheath protein FI
MGKKKRGRKGKASSGGYVSPGVYTEEVSSGSKPIEGVGTAVAAFIGLAPASPVRLAATATTLVVVALAVGVVRSRS